MTATTSKLGADMTDEQLIEIASRYAHSDGWLNGDGALNFARALLARQPAAIGNEADDDIEEASEILTSLIRNIQTDGPYSAEATCTFLRQALNCLPVAAPLANEASKPAVRNCQTGWADFCLMAKHDGVTCPSESCDIDDGIRAAASVEQDERGAISEHDAKGLEIIASWMDRDGLIQPAEFLRSLAARAASTSANVAQMKALVYDALSARVEKLGFKSIADAFDSINAANVAQGAEAVYQVRDNVRTWIDVDAEDYERCPNDDRRIVYTAPPAQTAITGDARDSIIEAMARAMNMATDGHERYWSGYVKSAEAAFDAAQSASGDTNG